MPGEARLDTRRDLNSARALERLVGRRARVPAVRATALGQGDGMLHERDALALHGVRDERLRPFVAGAEASEGLPERPVVVAVAALHEPAEGSELRLEIAEREDLLGRLVGLQLVAIDDDPKTSKAVMGRGLQRLPVLTLLELAVAGHHDHAAVASGTSLRERDSAALGDAHAERARVRLDPRNAHVRMPVEPADAPQAKQALSRNHPEAVQRGVQAWHVVALRRKEDVPVRVLEPELGDVQLLEEQVRDDVERAEARPEMTRPRALDRDERVEPADVREQAEASIRTDICGSHAVELRAGNELHHDRDASAATRRPDDGPPRPRGRARPLLRAR